MTQRVHVALGAPRLRGSQGSHVLLAGYLLLEPELTVRAQDMGASKKPGTELGRQNVFVYGQYFS